MFWKIFAVVVFVMFAPLIMRDYLDIWITMNLLGWFG